MLGVGAAQIQSQIWGILGIGFRVREQGNAGFRVWGKGEYWGVPGFGKKEM